MAEARPHPWTVDDFLAFEAEEPERYEFVDGIVRMMTGGSAAHSAIKGNIFAELRTVVRGGPCRVDFDDLKVVTASAVMYPDVLVICRPLVPEDDRVADPIIVVEAISPTTETHDRIRKWREYQTIASLQHFVVVAQSERRVEVYSREGAGWQLAVIEPPDGTIAFKAIGANRHLRQSTRAVAAEALPGLIARRALPTRRASDECGAGGASPGVLEPRIEQRRPRCASTTTPMPI